MIEDFFLGASTDDLLNKYEGGTRNRVDILKYISENLDLCPENNQDAKDFEFLQEFKVRPGGYYNADNLLTIGNHTKKISKWVTEDPVLLHRTIVAHNIHIDKDYYKVLMSKLMVNHREYYRDYMGLKLYVNFPGYDDVVMASVPYSIDPVAFYKWWRKNPGLVTMSKDELLSLFKFRKFNLLISDCKIERYEPSLQTD